MLKCVNINYYTDKKCTNEISKPTKPGIYYVKAIVSETMNYTGLDSVVKFEILVKEKPSRKDDNVQTGDDRNIIPYMMLSGISLGTMILIGRRKENDEE